MRQKIQVETKQRELCCGLLTDITPSVWKDEQHFWAVDQRRFHPQRVFRCLKTSERALSRHRPASSCSSAAPHEQMRVCHVAQGQLSSAVADWRKRNFSLFRVKRPENLLLRPTNYSDEKRVGHERIVIWRLFHMRFQYLCFVCAGLWV